ncbi:hypothetical protein [Aureimonas phyllosphaerae]|uniref:HIRAN domain-containing protein n=1 Tax=Aureimonas phyllosphaerae TaxID=1166078 RepID=A0A7W6FWN2_9HYPH|nr:hypothetical protein [Aureimonas phyllosphaerae]MBB3938100.1 hypothetical protein [Aureimonas phyllosphaerae]MBB3962107.1 hypothetical protein [Aureimonas phyllosphaerae]SFF55943.1 hypothetical protein SAMN05216566_12820 [Aureimonas phyllosphaerae]
MLSPSSYIDSANLPEGFSTEDAIRRLPPGTPAAAEADAMRNGTPWRLFIPNGRYSRTIPAGEPLILETITEPTMTVARARKVQILDATGRLIGYVADPPRRSLLGHAIDQGIHAAAYFLDPPADEEWTRAAIVVGPALLGPRT